MTAVINVTTTGTITAAITAATIAFTAPDTITDTGSGLGIFSPGDYITISGSTANNGNYIVATAAAGTVTVITFPTSVSSEFVAEVAGPAITMSAGIGLQIFQNINYVGEPLVLVHPNTTDLGTHINADEISNDPSLQAALTGGDVTMTLDGTTLDVTKLAGIGSGYPITPGFIDQDKVIYVSKAGSDSNDGKTPGKAKLTFGAAVTSANATSPSASDKALVIGLDAGSYFVTSTIAVAASVDIDAPSAELQTLGEYDMMTVVDDTDVTLGRITVQDDDAFDGIRHIGGSNTLTNIYVKTADGLGEGKRFINESAGHMMVKIGNGKLDGNQGTMFYMLSGAGGKMTVERDYMNIGGGTIGVDAAEGASFHMDGGEIEGTTGTAVKIGDLRVTGQMGKIAMTGGTAYDIAPAAALGLVISEIVSGTRTQSSNNGGLIITNEADRQVYASQFKLGAYPGFGSMTLDSSPVVTDETATFQVGKSGIIAYLSDVTGSNRVAVADAAKAIAAGETLIAYTSITVSRTATLPLAASVTAGTTYSIKDESGSVTGAIVIKVDGNGAETIDGVTDIDITVAYGSLAVYSNGTARFTV